MGGALLDLVCALGDSDLNRELPGGLQGSGARPCTPRRSRRRSGTGRRSGAPGFTSPLKLVDGNPYGTSHVEAQGTKPVDDTTRDAARHQVERVVKITGQLKSAA